MAWITPKTNWTANDGVFSSDLNRIESNIAFIADNPSGSALQLAPGGGNVLIGLTNNRIGKVQAIDSISLYGIDGGGGQSITQLRFFDDSDGTLRASIGPVASSNNNVYIDAATAPLIFNSFNNQNILIKTESNPGEAFHIGSGGMRVTGTEGAILIDANGRNQSFTRASANYIWASTAVGSIGIGTNGRVISAANANVIFNADQSTTFNGTVKWKKYYKTTSFTEATVFTFLATWVPTVGNYLSIHGQSAGARGHAIGLYRVSSILIQLRYHSFSSGTIGTLTIDSGSGVAFPDTEIMSNFDAVS